MKIFRLDTKKNSHLQQERNRLYSPSEHFWKETCPCYYCKTAFQSLLFFAKNTRNFVLQNIFSQHRNCKEAKDALLASFFHPFSCEVFSLYFTAFPFCMKRPHFISTTLFEALLNTESWVLEKLLTYHYLVTSLSLEYFIKNLNYIKNVRSLLRI